MPQHPSRPAHPTAPHPRARRHTGTPDEDGSASIQMVILMPVLFLIMFTGMQGALWYHARAVAIAAAQEGARTAAAEDGTLGAGLADAASFVADAGGTDVLAAAHVTGRRTTTWATVTVTGTAMSVIPGWTLTVAQSATAPVERITG